MELIPSAFSNFTLENYLIRVTTRSRMIYWIIIMTTVAGITALPFIYVDVSVQARGYFQSELERQIIYAPFQGKIVFSSIRHGNEVIKGDTLLIIDSETTKAQKNAIEKKITDNNSAIKDLEKLIGINDSEITLKAGDFYTQKYFAEYSSMIKSRSIQLNKYRKSKSEHERNDFLHKQEIIPDADFENSMYIFRSEQENLNQILVYHKNIWQADLMQRRNEAISLQADIERCNEELNNRIVMAPVSGEIIQSTDIQEGAMIRPDQQVAEISPAGELVANCYVNPRDIGLINTEQRVRIQVDAFNYNEWGLLEAAIIDISDDMIVENGSTAYFRMKCKPEKSFLSLKNGVKAEIMKGMSFNARIVVARRTLFNLLFDKAEKWFNPYLNRSGQIKDEFQS